MFARRAPEVTLSPQSPYGGTGTRTSLPLSSTLTLQRRRQVLAASVLARLPFYGMDKSVAD